MNISKELLSEVLNIEREIKHIDFIEKWNTFIYYVDGGAERTINIYELAHKCKEWAFNNNMMFDIRWHTNVNPFRISVMTYGKDSQFFVGGTEPEAVFKATSYIMEQLKQRD